MRLLIAAVFMVLSAWVCFAQAALKKTDLTVADRAAWQKVLGWPVELEQHWLKSRTINDRDQSLCFIQRDAALATAARSSNTTSRRCV